jgi:predicted unusual protein kinase regulating ubiquinone biosynthesis (AarF/ABC1/UbiB family)
VILDCGIVYSSASEEEHKKLVDICFAFMQHDGHRAGELMVDVANTRAKNSKEVVKHTEEFCQGVQGLVDSTENEHYFEHISEYFTRICELARTHVVRLDPGYFKIAMALKVAEGIALALNRELDLVSKCVPIILKTRAMRKLGLEEFPLPELEEDEIKRFMQKSSK